MTEAKRIIQKTFVKYEQKIIQGKVVTEKQHVTSTGEHCVVNEADLAICMCMWCSDFL